MSPETAEALAVAAVPLLSYLIIYGLGYAIGYLPKVLIPILAGALGPVSNLLIELSTGYTAGNAWVAVLLGGAGVAIAEAVGQISKQRAASSGNGRLVKARQETGMRVKTWRA